MAESITATKEYTGAPAAAVAATFLFVRSSGRREGGLELTWESRVRFSVEGRQTDASLVNMDFTNDPTNLYALLRKVVCVYISSVK